MKNLFATALAVILCLTAVGRAQAREESSDAGAEESSAEQSKDERKEEEKEKKKRRHFIIGLDGHLLAGLSGTTGEVGGGFAGRMGWQNVGLDIFAFRPEIGLGYSSLTGENVGRVFAGARMGIQAIIGVYAYGHAGYGWTTISDGFTYDVGLALDLVLFSLIRPGIHVDYMEVRNNLQAVRAGLHIDLAF
jgi:hypothetical protein